MKSDVRHVAGAAVDAAAPGRFSKPVARQALRRAAIIAAATGLFILLPSAEIIGLSAMGASAPDEAQIAANQTVAEEVHSLILAED